MGQVRGITRGHSSIVNKNDEYIRGSTVMIPELENLKVKKINRPQHSLQNSIKEVASNEVSSPPIKKSKLSNSLNNTFEQPKVASNKVSSPPIKKSKLSNSLNNTVENLSLVAANESLESVNEEEEEEGLLALNNPDGFMKLNKFIFLIEHAVTSMRKTPNEAQVESKLTQRQCKEFIDTRINISEEYKALPKICLPYQK